MQIRLIGSTPQRFYVRTLQRFSAGALALAVAFLAVICPVRADDLFGVYRQLWTGLSSSPGNTLAALTNTTYNPNWPDNPNGGYTRIYTNFETEASTGMNLYGQRLRTFVVPPTNGSYIFWIASDDSSEMFLSSDENPTNMTPVCWVNAWTSLRQWTKETNQRSAPITLEAGRRYYLETLMQQGSGGDNLSVRWQLPNGSFEEPIPAFSVAGTRLIPYLGVDSLPGIFVQPTNTTAIEGQSVAFSLLVTNRSTTTYQWRLNGTNLAGVNAVKSVYRISTVSVLNDGQVYSCVVSNAAGAVTSAPVTLSVLPDTVRPTVARVLNLGATNVQVVFSEAVEAASATNLANYFFTNGLAITRAALNADNLTVMLTTAPLVYGSNYALVINGVRDRAARPNTITNNTRVTFIASPYATQDIGNPSVASVTTSLGITGLNVTAAGADIGGFADQCSFSYQLRSGDFDINVRLAGLNATDVWAKAGPMARETLDAGSRFAASLATPAMNGCMFEWRNPASSAASASGTFPANYPSTWLRLKRAGNTFSGFASYDGQSWMQLGSATISMPTQIYVGLAVSSHNSSQPATAQFRDIAEVTNAIVGTVVNPHEPLGPSSRKTGLVISEIMYKPAPRADSNNVEFVEIYNSNPWFEDLSGYQLLADNLSFKFTTGTIMPGGAFVVIAASPQSLSNVYGLSNVLGPYAGSLKKTDTLQLLDEQGAVLLKISYSNVSPWPVAADGAGHSLVLANPTYGEEDPRAWDISDIVGGSPGQMDAFRPSPLRSVVINEFLAHTDDPQVDYIELYNHGNQPVDISGCILTDDPATNKFVIPNPTTIPARGFVYYTQTNMNFSLSAAGETIYFKNPDQSRVLDAVRFDAQENGVAMGRWPDGADQFYRLAATTPGTANAGIRLSDVVINELMHQPISGNDDDQYIELYNRSTNTLNLGGWQLSDAVNFTFPSNTFLAPDAYLVVARNAARLRTNYANLNLANCIGDFSGKLSHDGEHLALTMPDTIVSTNSQGMPTTNTIHIVVNDLTYQPGGRWGQWAAGGGSSLELIDPNANPRLAPNWADSDETQKSAWVNIETTGVLDNGANYDPFIDYAQIGLLDQGESLVDNVEVRAGGTSGPNLVSNPDFETGLAGWSLQGDHVRSSLENPGYASSYSLHLRASDRVWTGANSAQVALNTNSLASGQTATLRFKARWLRGWPEILFRLNGNWLEATGPLPVPKNLGTPGARNSRYGTNAGPAIYAVTHTPSVPAANLPVVVTARAHDPDGLQSLTLYYRIDPANVYVATPMRDDGYGGDAVAGDGIFSATIPGQSAGVLAAFYIAATDSKGVATRFPAPLNDNGPVRECVVMFGDSNPGGSFGVYHLWITQTNATRWTQLGDLSNESHDATFVNGPRVIYNMQGRFAGSPYKQGFDTPYGATCSYKWSFPDDDKLLGATSFNKIHPPGNGPGNDASLQREQIANTFLRALGVPWLYKRMVALYVNGNRRGVLLEDTQVPDGDFVKEYYPNDKDGWLYKMQPWFEFGPFPTNGAIPFHNNSWCTLNNYTTTGGIKKMASYRYNFEVRRPPSSANDFTNVFSLVDAANSYGSSRYVANMENLADMENWMRVFAVNHAAGNWDCFGSQNEQNLYGYIGAKTRYSLLMWDLNIVFGGGSWDPGANLLLVNPADTPTVNIYKAPAFRRMYWRSLQELVNGLLNVANSGPLMDAKYNAFVASGLSVEEPGAIKSWLTQARDSIASQIAAENTAGFSVSLGGVTNDLAYVIGTAPVSVKSVWFNGVEYPITWTSVTNWQAIVPLGHGTNQFSVAGIDIHGQPIAGASGNVTAVYNGVVPSPVGQIIFSEIMYEAAVANAEYLELYNTSTNITFDLGGWQINGLAYTFPTGSLIGPNSFLVLAANRAAFAAAYGASVPLFDAFPGTLQNDGETLTLVQPATNGNVVVAKLRYEGDLPWPTNAHRTGQSLQLIDPRQDNWRAGNWTTLASNAPVTPQWVFVTTNIPATSSTLYIYLGSAGDIFVDDVRLVRGTGANLITNSDFESGLVGTWNLTANFTQSSISTLAKHGGNSSLHLVATAAGSGSGNAIYQVINPPLTNGQTYTLSFWYLQSTNGGPLTVRLSASSNPATVNPAPPANNLAWATPGTSNSVFGALALFPPLWLNELQAENLTGITNSAGQRSAWIELYNPGTNVVSLNDLYLANNYTNPTQWGFPTGAVINPGQFKIIFADSQTNLSTTNELHTSFTLSSGSGTLALTRLSTNAQMQVLDYINYSNLGPNHSYGSFPDGQSFERQDFFYTTAGASNNAATPPITVFINEFMADNANTLADPADNDYEDWFELYNAGIKAVDLGGYYLTDTLTNKFQFRIPSTGRYLIAPRGFLLVWADNEPGQNNTNRPDLHVNFKLDKDGEAIGLFGPDGDPVDYIIFGAQATDLSVGRYPDGGPNFSFMPASTPRASNVAPNTAPTLTSPGDKFIYLGQTITFTIQASDADQPSQALSYSLDPGAPTNATINPLTGVFTWVAASGQAAITNSITVRVTDNGVPPLSASQNFNVTAFPLPRINDLTLDAFTITFSWPSLPGQSYQIEYKNDLATGAWTPLGSPIAGTGDPLAITDDRAYSSRRFYRLKIVP